MAADSIAGRTDDGLVRANVPPAMKRPSLCGLAEVVNGGPSDEFGVTLWQQVSFWSLTQR